MWNYKIRKWNLFDLIYTSCSYMHIIWIYFNNVLRDTTLLYDIYIIHMCDFIYISKNVSLYINNIMVYIPTHDQRLIY